MPSRFIAIATLVLTLATGAWAGPHEKLLHSFPANPSDGDYPTAALISDGAGNLYGTTNFGGTYVNTGLSGTVFELSPVANGQWTEKILYNFSGGADGGYPYSSLIFDSQGNLYGTTLSGGDLTTCSNGCGVVFELTPNSDGTWTEKVLHTFSGSDGASPFGPLTFDTKGNLYGTTSTGGVAGANCWNSCGFVFQLHPQTGGAWALHNIYTFQGNSDAGNPQSQLVFDAQGNLYGTAGWAVIFPEVVFKLAPAAGSWTFQLLQTFPGCATCDLFGVMSGVAFDSQGNLYGTVPITGAYGYGFLYELTPSNGLWTLKVLHNFTNGDDGGVPYAAPIFDSAGNMYGTTSGGGNQNETACGDYGCGLVYELTPDSNGGWTRRTLHKFTAIHDGASPYAGLLRDSAGNLYGTTFYEGLGYGAAFEIKP